ncbi:hypothetical protein Pan258_44240 [Symmachiella dynata]|uniref:hypothetical protein n=1 Tax=Symmachiella dynata TaxID=2527995 RepID=UPI001189036A|nr:hypothetical protein [Symmachiella dynata]QDT50367.1 hypothetical protein Pan258_44240 [Symmachiella dynata]
MTQKKYIGSAIRHLASPWQGNIVAAALHEHTVSLWDISTGEQLSEFDTIMDFGGKRLALSHAESACLTAAYHIHGLACYNTPIGDLRWQRKDLKKIQRLTLTPDEQYACCCFSSGPGHVIDISNGETILSIRALDDTWFHPQNTFRLYQYRAHKISVVHQNDKEAFAIEPTSFSLLDVAFNERYLAITEAGADVRVFDLATGQMTMRHKQPEGHHVLRISAMPGTVFFHGVQWCFRKGGPKRLIRLSPDAATQKVIYDLGGPTFETEFCNGGRCLLTSDGDLIDCRTAKLKRKIEFPQPTE